MDQLEIIEKNPFRLLGVYINSPQRSIVANTAKANAFMKVGKTVSFPLDLTFCLPRIDRSAAIMSEASAKLVIANEKLKYALFWFISSTTLDTIAFNHLTAGDTDYAVSVWTKKETVSALQNLVILSLIKGDYKGAAVRAASLYKDYSVDLIKAILGEQGAAFNQQNLIHLFVSGLQQNASLLVGVINDVAWTDNINKLLVAPLIADISNEISKAKKIDASDSEASYTASVLLKNNTSSAFAKLRNLIPKTDSRYMILADKLGLAIMQCAINYYNNSAQNLTSAKRALPLQEYANGIVVGELAKSRCNENVSILHRIINELPPDIIAADVDAVSRALSEFSKSNSHAVGSITLAVCLNGGTDSIFCNIKSLIDNTKWHLISIKGKGDAYSSIYIKISTAVVRNAMNEIVYIVNQAQSSLSQFPQAFPNVRSVIREADRLCSILCDFGMEYSYRMDHFTPNRNQLSEILRAVNNVGKRSNSSSSGGCYIATMVYGDYDHPKVMVLRKYRDKVLMHHVLGREFVKFYYRYSPIWVEHLRDKKLINNFIRVILDKFVKYLKKSRTL